MKNNNKLRPVGETAKIIKALKKKIIMSSMIQAFAILTIAAVAIAIYCRMNLINEMYDEMRTAMISSYMRNEKDDYRIKIGGESKKNGTETPVCIIDYKIKSDTVEVLSRNAYVDSSILSDSVEISINSENDEGIIQKYNLIYHLHRGTSGEYIRIVFADYSHVKNIMRHIVFDEASIIVTLLTAMLIISISTARSAVKPIVEMWRKQEQFVMDASHELKTPLTVIIANNDIMKNHAHESVQEQMKWIKSTEEEANNMSILIEDLMTLSRGKSIPESMKSDVNFSKTVQQICLHFDAVAYEKNISTELTIENGIIITGNEKWLKQLVTVLIDNAIKYEPDGGRVSAVLEKEGKKAVLTVSNKLSHIAEEDLPKLFDRFYRSDKARSEGGFGLGLSIAKNVAEAHGGMIKAETMIPNGCSFIVTLNMKE